MCLNLNEIFRWNLKHADKQQKWQGKGSTVIRAKWQSSLVAGSVGVWVASNVQLLAPLSHTRVKQNHHWALNEAMPTTTENKQFSVCLSVSFSLPLIHTPNTHTQQQNCNFLQRRVEWTSLESIHCCLTTWKELSWLEKLVFLLPLLSCLDCPAAALLSLNEHKASLHYS